VQLYNAGLKPPSVRRKLAAVKSFYRWMEAEGYSEAGLIDYIAGRYRRDELPDVPNECEVARLIEGEIPHFLFQKTGYRRDERDRLIVELHTSGVQPSDLVNLDLEDCRGDSVLVRPRKGQEERVIRLTENAKAALGAWLPIRTALLEKFEHMIPATRALVFTLNLQWPAKRLKPRYIGFIANAAKACMAAAPIQGERYTTYRQREGANAERDRLILELLYGCALRVSELVGINLDDFQGEDVLLVRGKGKKERQVIVGEYARAALKVWLQVRQNLLQKSRLNTPALLFSVGPRRSAERLDPRSVRRIVRAVAEACGLDPEKWHPHLLRHAAATHMCDHGASLQAVSTLLGHARLSTTQMYTRVSVGRMMRTYLHAHPHAQK
jgi:site-specific recombinase XerD